jgi:hypothetical protein
MERWVILEAKNTEANVSNFNKLGPEETLEIRVARDQIEEILRQHPEYEWSYLISHNTFAR